jgi:hypothetical protein
MIDEGSWHFPCVRPRRRGKWEGQNHDRSRKGGLERVCQSVREPDSTRKGGKPSRLDGDRADSAWICGGGNRRRTPLKSDGPNDDGSECLNDRTHYFRCCRPCAAGRKHRYTAVMYEEDLRSLPARTTAWEVCQSP